MPVPLSAVLEDVLITPAVVGNIWANNDSLGIKVDNLYCVGDGRDEMKSELINKDSISIERLTLERSRSIEVLFVIIASV